VRARTGLPHCLQTDVEITRRRALRLGGAVAAEAAWQEGRRMDFESAVKEALAEPR
jgi:hypothetical protein